MMSPYLDHQPGVLACRVSVTRPDRIFSSVMPYRVSRSVTSRSLKRTVPALGGVSPVRMLISVDLPAPLGPMIETNSPAATPRLTPSRAQNSP